MLYKNIYHIIFTKLIYKDTGKYITAIGINNLAKRYIENVFLCNGIYTYICNENDRKSKIKLKKFYKMKIYISEKNINDALWNLFYDDEFLETIIEVGSYCYPTEKHHNCNIPYLYIDYSYIWEFKGMEVDMWHSLSRFTFNYYSYYRFMSYSSMLHRKNYCKDIDNIRLSILKLNYPEDILNYLYFNTNLIKYF